MGVTVHLSKVNMKHLMRCSTSSISIQPKRAFYRSYGNVCNQLLMGANY